MIFTWLKRSTTYDDDVGELVESWNPNGTLYGTLEESSGSETKEYGARRERTEVAITINGFPSLQAVDRLSTSFFPTGSAVYIIDGIARGNYSLKIQAHRFEDNEI